MSDIEKAADFFALLIIARNLLNSSLLFWTGYHGVNNTTLTNYTSLFCTLTVNTSSTIRKLHINIHESQLSVIVIQLKRI